MNGPTWIRPLAVTPFVLNPTFIWNSPSPDNRTFSLPAQTTYSKMSATREDVQAMLDLLTREHVERQISVWLKNPRHAAIYRELEKEISADGDYPGYASFHILVFCALLPSEEDEYILEHPDAADIYRCVRTALDCRLSLEEGGIGEFGKFTGLSLLQFRYAAYYSVIWATNIEDGRQVYVPRFHLQRPPDELGSRPVVSRNARRMADEITEKFRQIATPSKETRETSRLVDELCTTGQCEGFGFVEQLPCLRCGVVPESKYTMLQDPVPLSCSSWTSEFRVPDLQSALNGWEAETDESLRCHCSPSKPSLPTRRRWIKENLEYLVVKTRGIRLETARPFSSPLLLQGEWLLHSALIINTRLDELAVCGDREEMEAMSRDSTKFEAICLIRIESNEHVPILLRNNARWHEVDFFGLNALEIERLESEPFFFHMPW